MIDKKKMNKYYTGATHIASAIVRGENSSHTQATLEESIERAKKTLNDDPSTQAVIIVKIIRIVRRRDQPVIVEKV